MAHRNLISTPAKRKEEGDCLCVLAATVFAQLMHTPYSPYYLLFLFLHSPLPLACHLLFCICSFLLRNNLPQPPPRKKLVALPAHCPSPLLYFNSSVMEEEEEMGLMPACLVAVQASRRRGKLCELGRQAAFSIPPCMRGSIFSSKTFTPHILFCGLAFLFWWWFASILSLWTPLYYLL